MDWPLRPGAGAEARGRQPEPAARLRTAASSQLRGVVWPPPLWRPVGDRPSKQHSRGDVSVVGSPPLRWPLHAKRDGPLGLCTGGALISTTTILPRPPSRHPAPAAEQAEAGGGRGRGRHGSNRTAPAQAAAAEDPDPDEVAEDVEAEEHEVEESRKRHSARKGRGKVEPKLFLTTTRRAQGVLNRNVRSENPSKWSLRLWACHAWVRHWAPGRLRPPPEQG